MCKNKEPKKVDLSCVPLEKIIGYKPPEMLDADAKLYKEKIEYLEYLGIIGIFDDNENPQVEADRWQASYLIEMGKPIPQELKDRLISYKK